ncbi:hypothetical protein [Amycolatopsis speibonae]|uniref:Sensor histidine kinase n=1 Tax=Amycolatopsis speibonae TaxID=1450224 RepID=A0ABV7PAI7_9PSEU
MNQAVRVEARFDPGLSRWLWLVKWLPAIPHYVVVGLLVLIAGFVLLFTGAVAMAASVALVAFAVSRASRGISTVVQGER